MRSLEEDDKDTEQGGEDTTGVRIYLQRYCTVGVSLQYRDVGGYPLHGTGPGGFPVPCVAATDEEAETAEVRWDMLVHLGGGDKRVGVVQANGDLHLVKAEYGRALYCNVTNSGPVQGGGEEVGDMGRASVVGTGSNLPERGKRDSGGGSGGGI